MSANAQGHDVSLNRIAELLRQRGLTATRTEMTGGGVASIYIGVTEADFDDWENIVGIGPGWFKGSEALANTAELNIGNASNNKYVDPSDDEKTIADKAATIFWCITGKGPGESPNIDTQTEQIEAIERELGNDDDEPTPSAMLAAVETFLNAGYALSEAWNDAVGDEASDAYPSYLPSFDEFMANVLGFRDRVAQIVRSAP